MNAPPDTTAAAAARSILSCPATVGLVVDGVDSVLSDLAGRDGLALQDLDGVPTFSCPPASLLSQAAHHGRRALLSLESGVGDPSRTDVLTLGGRLASRGRDVCACCAEARDVVVLVVDLVALAAPDGLAAPRHVPAEDFAAPEHRLNEGFLRRCVEHATGAHQEELRHAVAALVDRPAGLIAGVALSDLTPSGVQVRWIDASGANTRDVRFPRVAQNPDDLGTLLRDELSAGLC